MKIDRYINKLLAFIWPENSVMGREVHFHSQNLNEKPDGQPDGIPYEGRCWLRLGRDWKFNFSWNLWTHFCGASFSFDPQEDGWQFHVAFPPVSFWWSTPLFSRSVRKLMESPKVEALHKKYGGYGKASYFDFEFFNISVHDSALWWTFLKSDWGWSREMPKWMSGSFHFDDFFLGRTKYQKEVLEVKDVQIPMPEGLYPAKATMEKCIWKRPLWFAKKRFYVSLDIPRGIPHQGKGENSWDCGEDGLFGCSSEGRSYEKAIAKAVEISLTSRRKYGGKNYQNPANRPPPKPPTDDNNSKPAAC